MYSTSNREPALREKNGSAPSVDMDNMEILEKAIVLVRENAPPHRELIGRLAMAAQEMAGIEPIFGLDERFMTYTDRPKAVAKTILDGLRYSR